MHRKSVVLITVAVIALAVASVNNAQAAKPPKPTATAEPPVGGTVYFDWGGSVYTMEADGGSKTLLPDAVSGVASHDLHDAHRWFLVFNVVQGETYPYPYDAIERHELYAVRDDGAGVQLTNDPDMMLWAADWAPESGVGPDARVAAIGIDFSPAEPIGGVFRGNIDFDGSYSGAITGLEASPTMYVEFAMVPDPDLEFPEIAGFDFSPGGVEFVYGRRAAAELWIWRPSGATHLAGPYAGGGVWSPEGTKIAYAGNESGRPGIFTINPDGSGKKKIVSNNALTTLVGASFSPTGSHLLYHESHNLTHEMDIYRIGTGGGGKSNLTDDIEGRPFVIGWRQ